MTRALAVLLAGAASIWPASGLTQDYDARHTREEMSDFSQVTARGGIGSYSGALAPYTAAGPTWGVAFGMQPWRLLGGEVAYEGARNLVTDSRLTVAPSLTRHGVSALAKLGLPLMNFRPFIGAGLGFSKVFVGGSSQGLYSSDFMEEIPLALGIEYERGHLVAGARTTYRLLVDEGFVNSGVLAAGPQGGLIDTSVTLGGKF